MTSSTAMHTQNLLPVYTQPAEQSLLSGFFSKVSGYVSVPSCDIRPTPKAYRQALMAIDNEIANLKHIESTSRAFENVGALQADRLKYLYKTAVHFEVALCGVPDQIDLDFLGNYTHQPVFGITRIDRSGMTITANKYGENITVDIDPKMPADIRSYYCNQNILNYFNKFLLRSRDRYFISAAPYGKMPDDLSKRLEIILNSGLFQDHYVVFEAKWEAGKSLSDAHKAIEYLDPLIIGRRYSSQFPEAGPVDFLIGAYLPTPHEEYISKNYALTPHFKF